jgi:hypothetical protein
MSSGFKDTRQRNSNNGFFLGGVPLAVHYSHAFDVGAVFSWAWF